MTMIFNQIRQNIENDILEEQFEDIKLGNQNPISRTDNAMAKRKSTKGQTTIYKTYK